MCILHSVQCSTPACYLRLQASASLAVWQNPKYQLTGVVAVALALHVEECIAVELLRIICLICWIWSSGHACFTDMVQMGWLAVRACTKFVCSLGHAAEPYGLFATEGNIRSRGVQKEGE